MTVAEYRDCPDCGTPVMRGPTFWRSIRWLLAGTQLAPCSDSVPIGSGWLEYARTQPAGLMVWTIHSPTRCAYVAAHDGR